MSCFFAEPEAPAVFADGGDAHDPVVPFVVPLPEGCAVVADAVQDQGYAAVRFQGTGAPVFQGAVPEQDALGFFRFRG